MSSETSKIRNRIFPYIKKIQKEGGIGIDIGCGNDKITPEADAIDVQPFSHPRFWQWKDLSNLNNLRDKCYDYVYSSLDLSLKDKNLFLKEWLRILKDDGTLFLYEPYDPKSLTPSILLKDLREFVPNLWIVSQELDINNNYFILIIRKKSPEKPRFLIKANKNIGDCLTAVNCARALKQNWEEENGCHITIDSNTLGMYDNCEFIDEIKEDVSDQNDVGNAFDGIISMVTHEHEFGNYYRRTIHFIDFPKMIASVNGYCPNMVWDEYFDYGTINPIPREDYNWNKVPLSEVVGDLFVDGYVVISPDVFVVRSWEKHKWNSLILSIIKSGKYVVLVGQNKNEKYIDTEGLIDLRGDTPTIGHIEAVCKGADFGVCPDTGIAHILAILNIHHFVIGGPADLDLTFYNNTFKIRSNDKFYGIQNKCDKDEHGYIKYSEGEQPPIFSDENPPNTICPSMESISCLDVINTICKDLRFKIEYVEAPRPTLSVCITERNEEEVIVRAMDSVVGLADEIVIHDTGSTDKTLEKVREWNSLPNDKSERKIKVKIIESGDKYHVDGLFHFGNAKTKAFQEATSDYVMWMDASDYIESRASTKKLREILEREVLNNRNIYIECFTGLGGKFRRERIVPREGAEFVYPCHEVIKLQPGLTKVATDIIILHSHATNQWKESANRNLKILEKEWEKASKYKENGYPRFDASRMCFYLANTKRELGNYEEAINLYKTRIDHFWNIHPEEVFKSYEYITECIIQQIKKGGTDKKWEDVIDAANCCVYYWNGRREGYYYLGDAYLNMERYEEAIEKYVKCLSLPIPDVQLWINTNVHSDEIIKQNISHCQKQLKKEISFDEPGEEINVKCILCGNEKAIKPRQDLGEHPYVECTNCGLYYQPEPPPEKIYEAFHEVSGDQMSDNEKAANKQLAEALYNNHITKKMPSKEYFHLDVGSKYPYLGHCLQKVGNVKSFGMDGIKEVIKFGEELGVETKQRDIEKEGLEWENKFHLITVVHCFEHFYDPIKVLKEIRKSMLNGGLLFLRSPDSQTEGIERDFTKGHYDIHPTIWCEKAMNKILTIVEGLEIEETYTLYGQRDYIMRAK